MKMKPSKSESDYQTEDDLEAEERKFAIYLYDCGTRQVSLKRIKTELKP
jgi:hypothetical protein